MPPIVPVLVPPDWLNTTVSPPVVRLFPAPSLACSVSVAVAPDTTVLLDVVTVDVVGEAVPGVTVTVGWSSSAVPLAVADTVLLSARVEASVTVATPLPLAVIGKVAPNVFAVPVAPTVTEALGMTFPFASRTITVTVAVLLPDDAVIAAGDSVTEDCDPLTGPGVAVATKFTGEPAAVARSVWAAVVGPSVQLVLAIPLPLVTELGGATDPPPPLTAHVTVTFGTALFN